MLKTIIEAAVLAATLSIDSFAAGFAYGSNKIKVPLFSVQIISLITSGMLGLSVLTGTFVKNLIPPWLGTGICFSILFIIGLIKLVDGFMKSFIGRHVNLERHVEFSMFSLRFILSLYAKPEDSDIDKSKTISSREAISLALALSFDGLAAGFGAAMGNANGGAVIIWSFIANTLLIISGCNLGKKIAKKTQFNLSWIGGAVLIIMAVLKILPL